MDLDPPSAADEHLQSVTTEESAPLQVVPPGAPFSSHLLRATDTMLQCLGLKSRDEATQARMAPREVGSYSVYLIHFETTMGTAEPLRS